MSSQACHLESQRRIFKRRQHATWAGPTMVVAEAERSFAAVQDDNADASGPASTLWGTTLISRAEP